jgi:2-hydroxychromene-2-carboxylate isomerase
MLTTHQYSIADIKDEVRALVARGLVGRQQRIYELRKYFGDRRWQNVEQLLDKHDYVLRGHIIDLVGKESWIND